MKYNVSSNQNSFNPEKAHAKSAKVAQQVPLRHQMMYYYILGQMRLASHLSHVSPHETSHFAEIEVAK